jgi:hypothetical protein
MFIALILSATLFVGMKMSYSDVLLTLAMVLLLMQFFRLRSNRRVKNSSPQGFRCVMQ